MRVSKMQNLAPIYTTSNLQRNDHPEHSATIFFFFSSLLNQQLLSPGFLGLSTEENIYFKVEKDKLVQRKLT